MKLVTLLKFDVFIRIVCQLLISSFFVLVTTSGRQDRYERKLAQGHNLTLSPIKVAQENYALELKRQICDMMKDGKRLTQGEARRIFSQYLSCILKRLTTTSTAGHDCHVEMVVKFLQKASKYLKTPFLVKVKIGCVCQVKPIDNAFFLVDSVGS